MGPTLYGMASNRFAVAWAAMAVVGLAMGTSGGCASLIGADWSSYLHGVGEGGTGGDGGGVECSADEGKCSENTPQRCVDGRWENGEACVGQTCVEGHCIGECGPDDVRCADDRPQRCDERGAWGDAEPCTAAAPACDGGKCVPRSCVGLTETCGPDANESCCATAEPVAGGTFNRGNDAMYPATVSGFLLDRFEVTVGRFRRFVEAYPGSKPAAGAGAHPKITGRGWDAAWDGNLPAVVNASDPASGLKAAVKCDSMHQTWRDTDEGSDHLPMNCVSWYVAFAFCAWDGGRLATEAEWNYAAAGGDEQRPYPWSDSASDETINDDYAVYDCTGDGSESGECAFSGIRPVGSKSREGDGRWGQADLAGNLWEWVLDWYKDPYVPDCNDCANVTSASYRVLRGGGWNSSYTSDLLSSHRNSNTPSNHFSNMGVRCARTP